MKVRFSKRTAATLVGVILLGGVAAAGYVAGRYTQTAGNSSDGEPTPTVTPTDAVVRGELTTFNSCEEIAGAFKETRDRVIAETTLPAALQVGDGIGGGGAPAFDYTRTNVQVEGVDEADIVKTDGTYLLTLVRGERKLHVARVSSHNRAGLLSTIVFSERSYPQEFFLRGTTVMVFGNRIVPHIPRVGEPALSPVRQEFGATDEVTFVEWYSIENPRAPRYLRTVEFEGMYRTSRMIGGYVYFVLTAWPEVFTYVAEEGETTPSEFSGDAILPRYRDTLGSRTTPSFVPAAPCASVARIDPITSQSFLAVAALSIDDPEAPTTRRVIAGAGENVYASSEHLYVASSFFDYSRPIALEAIGFPVFEKQETIVNKFALQENEIEHTAQTRVPGTILNQFSMDEFEGNFRIATTVGEVFGERPPTNGVYILDQNLTRLGTLEGLAPTETIYAARFMGKRAYLVTFQKVDPFFVIDLAEPRAPKVLGALKIPGYSDYLHPYDEAHVIGVGKNAVGDESGTFAWYQGMKIALFDVTDPASPKELYKVDIGDRGTDSEVLTDHKAFLFDPARNLLALPVLLAEYSAEQKRRPERDVSEYATPAFQGTYVYELTLDRGFRLLGRVTHLEGSTQQRPDFAYSQPQLFIRRNIRIGDTLYSISDGKIVGSVLPALSERVVIPLNP